MPCAYVFGDEAGNFRFDKNEAPAATSSSVAYASHAVTSVRTCTTSVDACCCAETMSGRNSTRLAIHGPFEPRYLIS
jgi:hypothetical protein